MVKIRIRLFAAAKDLVDSSYVEVEVGENSNVADAVNQLRLTQPKLNSLISLSRWALAEEFVELDCKIDPRNELAMIPPVSGG